MEAAGGNMVRVPAEKLDAFLARSGELLVARRRVRIARPTELAALREFVGRWKAEWRAVEKPLRQFLQETGPEEHATNGRAPAAVQAQRLPRRAVQPSAGSADNLRQLEKDLEHLTGGMAADGRVLKEAAGAIDDEVRRVRMLPFAEACQGLDRMVRDLAQAGGKEVELVIEGGDVELDRSVLEGLKDPLRHLVRNAVDHGAETPEERRRPASRRDAADGGGRGARRPGGGGGGGRRPGARTWPPCASSCARKASPSRPTSANWPLHLPARPVHQPAHHRRFRPRRRPGRGQEPGRGAARHGRCHVHAGRRHALHAGRAADADDAARAAGRGRRPDVRLRGDQRPEAGARGPPRLRSVEGREMLALGGTPVPVASLAETLGLRGAAPAAGGKAPVVVVAAGDKRMAFVVDELLAEQEVVVKGLGAAHPPYALRLGGDDSALGQDRPGPERAEPGARGAWRGRRVRRWSAPDTGRTAGEETHPGRRRFGHHADPGEEHPGGRGLRRDGGRRRRGRLAAAPGTRHRPGGQRRGDAEAWTASP